jgi:hypothetical protein
MAGVDLRCRSRPAGDPTTTRPRWLPLKRKETPTSGVWNAAGARSVTGEHLLSRQHEHLDVLDASPAPRGKGDSAGAAGRVMRPAVERVS